MKSSRKRCPHASDLRMARASTQTMSFLEIDSVFARIGGGFVLKGRRPFPVISPLSAILVFLVVASAAPATVHAQVLLDAPAREDADRITEIRVEGNRRVEAAAIARALKQKVGDLFDPTRTAD